MANTKNPDSNPDNGTNKINVPKDTVLESTKLSDIKAAEEKTGITSDDSSDEPHINPEAKTPGAVSQDQAKTISATKLSTDNDVPYKPTDPEKNDETSASPGGKQPHTKSNQKPAKNVYVKLSDLETDILPKKMVSDMVNRSQISHHHKLKIWDQVNKGQLAPDYSAAVRALQLAESQGSTYRPGQNGL